MHKRSVMHHSRGFGSCDALLAHDAFGLCALRKRVRVSALAKAAIASSSPSTHRKRCAKAALYGMDNAVNVRSRVAFSAQAVRPMRAGCISEASCTIPEDSAVAMHASRLGKACRMQCCIVHPKCRQRSFQHAMSDGIQRSMSGNVCDTMPEDQATAFSSQMPRAGKPQVRRRDETGQPWRSLHPGLRWKVARGDDCLNRSMFLQG